MASGSPQDYVAERQNLMERLLDAVKQCQVRFGGKSEVAADSDSRVMCLCQQFEVVLQHGYKKNKRIGGPGILRSKMGSSQKQDSQPFFWTCVKEHLSKSELERFNTLEHITTDAGRGRAWLRAALNEHTLERYIQDILADMPSLKNHYEPYAFLLDVERASMLPQMAAGLSSILFAAVVDNPELNGLPKSRTGSSPSFVRTNKVQQNVPEAVVAPEAKEMVTVKRKKKTKRSKHNEFLDNANGTEEAGTSYPSTSSTPVAIGSQSVSASTTPSVSAQNTPSGDEHGSDRMARSGVVDQDNGLDTDASSIELVQGYERQINQPHIPDQDSNAAPETQDKRLSLASMTEPGEIQINPHASIDSWKPRTDMPRPSTGSFRRMPSEAQAAVQALQAAHRAQESLERSNYSSRTKVRSASNVDKPGQSENLSDHLPLTNQLSPPPDSMTNAELKQAIIAVVQRKDEVEARNSELSKEYETAIRKAELLEEELQAVREEATHSNEDSQAKLQALSRENELLKHQLKRYVGVVQTMRRERGTSTSLSKEAAEAVSAIPQLQPAAEPLRFRADTINEAEHYEQKLVQVTEMHGELMEFNEHLHIQLLRKELEVRRLRSQLAHYRGEDSPSELPGNEGQGRHERNPSCPGLVNVWIPTAFLHGRGGDSHHVYQVFIRIQDEEWNVYRRYTQFRELYRQACAFLPEVKTFDFPPKKTLGNRDEDFVEVRRQRLQAFLRFLFEVILKGGEGIDGTALDIKSRPSKKALMKSIPFFGESTSQRPTGPPVGSHQYSGL